MTTSHKTSRLIAIPVFVAAMGVSPIVYAQYGTSPRQSDQSSQSSAGQYIDDAAITAKIKAALISDPVVKATQVSVTTDEGVVQLTGTVDTKREESEALRVANQVNGVRSVKDLLNVRGPQDE